MADRNDIDIKVGVTGTKRALEELGKLLDSYQQKEKALIQNTHLQEMNAIKQKEANQERLHANRMLKLKLESQKVLENARVMSQALTVQQKELKLQSEKTKELALQANVQASIANSQAKVAEAMARASVAPGIQAARLAQAEAKAQDQAELGSLKIAKETNNELKTRQQVRKAELQVQKEEVQLENAINNQLSNEVIKRNNIVASEERALAAVTRRYNVEASGQRAQEQGVVSLTMSKARLDRFNEKNAQNDADRLTRLERQAIRFAQQQEDRAARQARQGQGFFGGLLGPQIGGAIENLGRLNLAFMVVTNAVRPFVDTIAGAVNEYARFEIASIGFNSQLMNMGQSIAQGNRIVREFQDGISDPTSVMRAVQMMAPMNLSYQKQIDLINAIRDGVVSMGGDVNEQLPLMVLAIRRGSSELLDNMGITKNADEVYKEFARSIGKKVSELTEDQKQTALVNAVILENKKVNGLARESADTFTGSMNRLSTSMKEIQKNVVSYLEPGLKSAIDLFDRLAKAASNAIPRIKTPLELLREQLPTKEEARAQLTAAQQNVTSLEKRVKEASDKFERVKQLYKGNELGQAQAMAIFQPGVEKELNQLRDQLSEAVYVREQLGKLMNEYINTEQAAMKQEYAKLPPVIKPEADSKEAEKKRKEAEKQARKAESEAERRERERIKRMNELADKQYREGAARGAVAAKYAVVPRFGKFQASIYEAPQGASLEEQRSAALKTMQSLFASERANYANLKGVIAQQNIVTVLPKEQIEKLKKDREAIEKAIKDGADNISEYQNKIEDIDQKIKEKRIQETADFMRGAFSAAYKLMQGDFSEFAANIGGILSDQIIKALSENEDIRNAIKPMTDALVSGMSAAATAISGIITGIAKFLMTSPLVLPLAGIAAAIVGMGLIIKNSVDEANKRLEEYKSRVDKFQAIVNPPAKTKTKREQAMEELPYWEQERERRRQALERAKTYRGGGGRGNQLSDAEVARNVKRAQDAYNETEIRIIQLGDVIKNDLDDPMSEASKSAKKLADAEKAAAEAAEWAAENIRKSRESTKEINDFVFDLENKIFEQRIDQMVRQGKMTEEEGRRQKENMRIQNESMDLYVKARDMAKGFVPGSFGGIEQAMYSDAFQKFQSGDITGMETSLRSIGIDPLEQANLIKVWKDIAEYITGRGVEANMPGSSPDKPIYTQVVNVRDFREAFPDTAYFRGGLSDTTRSTSTGMNVNTAVSKSSQTSPTSSAFPVGRGRGRTVYA